MSMSACTSMIGNTIVAELALEMLRDSDLVGGASSLYIIIIIPPRPHCLCKVGLFSVTSATVRDFLLRASLYTTTHYKDTACKTTSLSYSVVSSRLYARIHATATVHVHFIGLNMGC